MRFAKLLRGTASLAVLSAFVAGAAYAQEDDVTSVDEIVVTAQKREQSLQDVPVVVTSISAELLQEAGVRDIKDLQILTPGLTVTSTSNETVTTARIRGVGTVGDNPGLESSVGVVVDGVYRPRNGVGFGDLGELQRIEVLKGPQGTLFGKNTSAGVINIISKAPSFQPGFDGELTAGNYNAFGASASITGPIIGDTLAGRLYVAGRTRDGFYDVVRGDGPRGEDDDANQSFRTFRGQLLFLPSDSAEIRVIADYTERDERCCAAVQTRSGPTSAFVNALALGGNGVATTADPFARRAFSNRDTDQQITDKGVSLEANVDLDHWNATFTSVTAIRSWETQNGQDVDFSGADIVYRPNDGGNGSRFDTLSQEFRLAGATDNLDWLVGVFFAAEDLTRNDNWVFGADYSPYLSLLLTASVPAALGGPNPGRLGCFTVAPYNPACPAGLVAPNPAAPQFAAGSGYRDTYAQDSNTIALFTNNTFSLTDQFDITVGLRYTVEEKSVNTLQRNTGTNGAACGGALTSGAPASAVGLICLPWANPLFNNNSTYQENEEKEWSGTIKGTYRFNDDIMAYASYARGYKGGGFNLDRVQSGVTPVTSTYFPAEFVDSYEIGAKTTWLDGSLLLNVTGFIQKFEDFQLNTFLGTAFVVESIPGVESRGVDADLIWFTPIDGLSFQGGLTYAKTEYDNFTAADLSNTSRFNALQLLPGNQMSFAPEWSASGAFSFDREIGWGLKTSMNLSAKYVSEYNTGSDLLPAKIQESFTLLNGRIGIGSEDDRWTLELWGQNLTDEEYYQVVFNQPLQGSAFTTPTPPATSVPYNPAADTQTYAAFLGQPRTMGVTLRVKY